MKEDEMLLETIKEIGGDLSRVRADNEKTEAMLNRMEKGVGYEAMKAVLENELMRQAKLEQVVNWLVELRRLKKEKRSKGHWRIAHGMHNDRIWCDCGFIKVVDKDTVNWKFCPVCGAGEKEKSEDKE